MEEDSLDVLAGAEAVDPKIGAGAAELPVSDITNFNAVVESAARVHRKIGEDGMLGAKIHDAGPFLASAPGA